MLLHLAQNIKLQVPKIILSLFAIVFSLILVQIVFFNSSFGYSFVLQAILVSIWFCLFIGLGLLFLKYEKILYLNRYKILVLVLLFLFLVQTFVSIVTYQQVDHDYGKVYNGAVIYTIEGNSEAFQVYRNYYHHFTNNTGEFLFLYFIFKPMYALGLSNFYGVTMVLGHLFFTLAILFTFLYLEKAFGFLPALFSLFFFLAYLPVYFQSSIGYTDTFSIWAPPILLYIYQKCKEIKVVWKKIFLYILFGLLLAFSTQIKATVIIIAIAIFIESIFTGKWKSILLFIGSAGTAFLIFTSLFQAIAYTVILDKQQVENEGMPVTFWLMMGLQGDGSYNPTDEWYITCSVAGKKARQELNIEYSKDRLREMGFTGYIQLLHRKTSRSFGSGNGEINYLLVRQPYNPSHWIYSIISTEGRFFRYFDNLSHSLYLLFYVFSILGAILAIQKKNKLFLANFSPFLGLIGFYFFMLLWESNHRQLINQCPLYIMVASAGAGILLPHIQEPIAKHISFLKIKE